MSTKPVIALDVDGPLNPYGAKKPEGYTLHKLNPDGYTYDVWLNHGHGALLLAFAEEYDAELVWATTWEAEANRLIGPHIGLPELPVVDFGWRRKLSGVIMDHWKFDGLLAHAAGRPLVFFDDDFVRFPTETVWFTKERGDLPTLLHEVSPSVGLTEDDLSVAGRWLKELDV